MKKKNKIIFVTLAFALTFGGGLATTDFLAEAGNAPVADNVLESLVLEQGMAIRTSLPDGLRFTAKIGMSDEGYAASGIKEIGTVLMPTANVDGELTVDEADGEITALLIKTEKWITETDANSKSYHSTLVATDKTSEFPAAFYNTPVSARAYAIYEDGTVKYSANTESRSIGYVASFAALDSTFQGNKEVVEKIVRGTTKSLTVNGGETLSLSNADGYQAALIVGGVTTVSTDKITVVWSVKETDAAVSVDENGIVTPVKAGTATLVATAYVGENYLSEEVSVSVAEEAIEPTTAEVAMFAIKQTNDNGSIVENDYTYEGLNGTNVSSLSFDGGETEVSTDAYSLENGVLTVSGSAFAEYVGTAKTLSVKTEADDLTVSFGKVATFAVTKASDMDTNNYTVSPMIQATLISDASGENGISWGGYIVLANDIDFRMDTIETTLKVLGTQYNGMDYGFKGTFDGQGYALKNFDLWGNSTTPGSLFGRIAFEGSVNNVKFLNFRIRGAFSLGLFDECWGTINNVVVDGTIETNMNDSSLMGKFNKNNENSGAVLKDSTIIARVGSSTHAYSSTETDNKVFRSGATFRFVENTTLQTAFETPTSFENAGGEVEALAPADYYAVKVNGDTDNTVKTNDAFTGAVQGTTLQSVTLYGRNGDGVAISGATLADGNVVIPATSLASYVGRGQTLKVVTDAETKYFYQDVVTYAIQEAGDLCAVDAGSSAVYECAEFVQACGVTSGTAYTGNWGSGSLIILAHDVDCSTFVAWSGAVAGRIRTGAPLDYDPNKDATGVRFEGIFDGRGYSISNIQLYARANDHGDAFFGALGTNGTVKNLSIVNASIADGRLSQGFFGQTSIGTIENVYIDVTPNSLESGYAIGRFNDSIRVRNCTFIVRTNSACATGEGGDLWKIIDYSGKDSCWGTNWTNTVIYSDYRVRSSDCNLNDIIKPLSELPTA